MLKRRSIEKNRRCSLCGRDGHTSIMCWNKPKKAMRQEAVNTRVKREATSNEWYRQHRPDKDGFYTCYLQISPYCPRKVDRGRGMTLEHVYSKRDYPELRYYSLNLKPACDACNKLKLSNSINKLCKFFPRLTELVATPEWQEWEDQMQALATSLGIRLDRPEPGQKPVTHFPLP